VNPTQAKNEEEEVIIIIADPPLPPPRKLLGVPLAPGVDSPRGLLRLWSVRWIIVGTVAETLPRAWATLPPEWAAPMPEPLKLALGYLVLLALVSAGVSRAIRQAP
jgi:hypothetical protein